MIEGRGGLFQEDRPERVRTMKGLLLLAFGGPRSLDEVEPFLLRLMKGRRPSQEQLERVKERYRLIGGASPLPQWTRLQAEALEATLRLRGHPIKAYVAMRYSPPFIEEAVREMLRDEVAEVFALPMTPLRSRGTTGAYFEELRRACTAEKASLTIHEVEGWHTDPGFLKAVCERVRAVLATFPPEEREKVHLLFTAHSLPVSLVENDPYREDLEGSAKAVVAAMGWPRWSVAFQSKGLGGGEWLGPLAEEALENLSAKGVRNVLVVPIGFVCDHIEILYDIDVVLRKRACSLGMTLRRVPSLNASEPFIGALAKVVEREMEKKGRDFS